MPDDPTDFPFGSNAAALVAAFCDGPLHSERVVFRAAKLLMAWHECDPIAGPGREAYLSVYSYPEPDYGQHWVANNHSARGYCGPAAVHRLPFDIDNADPAKALVDARTLYRFLADRYPALERGIGVWFSGSKGFHLLLPCAPGLEPDVRVPATAKQLALGIAQMAGVTIDRAVYDTQRQFRLPNSRHPKTGLYKRHLDERELFALDIDGIRRQARHPAGHPVPDIYGDEQLQADWNEAAATLAGKPVATVHAPSLSSSHPVVPLFVRNFIGFSDVVGECRAVTVSRAAACLAEAGTPEPVVRGLLEEPAHKTGLSAHEVEKQIRDGVRRGRTKAGAV